MKNSVLYGIIAGTIITGVVIASSDWVFAAPEDELDFHYVEGVKGSGVVVIECPIGELNFLNFIRLHFSEKHIDFFSALGRIFIEVDGGAEISGDVTTGIVTKDNFVIRGVFNDQWTDCANLDSPVPYSFTMSGTCGVDQPYTFSTSTNIDFTGTMTSVCT